MFYSRENENDYCDPIILSGKNYNLLAMGLTMKFTHTHMDGQTDGQMDANTHT